DRRRRGARADGAPGARRSRPRARVIDTHAHLDACGEPAAALLDRARAAGVDRVISIGCGIDSSRETIAIAEREPGVSAAIGVHPHQAGDVDADRLGELDELLVHAKVVALGEIGLDFYRDYAPRDRQRDVFAAQLRLAEERGLPVVIHARDAAAETAELLAGHR